jgi:ferric-dicitrate binding protein FerR (iron transport regulator)
MNKNYTIEELSINPEFINWVKEGQSQNSEWHDLSQESTQTQKVKEAISIVQSFTFKSDQNTQDRENHVWSRIEESIKVQDQPKKQSSIIRYIALTAAAACLAFLFIYRGGQETIFELTNSQPEFVSHQLPDKSRIDITPGSSINYNSDNYLSNREIELDGEAFFDVEKGESFIVLTEEVKVEVLGTSFLIDEEDGKTTVSCFTGRVKVTNLSSQSSTTLTAKESVLVSEDKAKIEKETHTELFVPWKEKDFTFRDQSLKSVFAEIETKYKMTINAEDYILSRNFTGNIPQSNIKNVLQQICWPMNLKYSIEGKQINISKTE